MRLMSGMAPKKATNVPRLARSVCLAEVAGWLCRKRSRGQCPVEAFSRASSERRSSVSDGGRLGERELDERAAVRHVARVERGVRQRRELAVADRAAVQVAERAAQHRVRAVAAAQPRVARPEPGLEVELVLGRRVGGEPRERGFVRRRGVGEPAAAGTARRRAGAARRRKSGWRCEHVVRAAQRRVGVAALERELALEDAQPRAVGVDRVRARELRGGLGAVAGDQRARTGRSPTARAPRPAPPARARPRRAPTRRRRRRGRSRRPGRRSVRSRARRTGASTNAGRYSATTPANTRGSRNAWLADEHVAVREQVGRLQVDEDLLARRELPLEVAAVVRVVQHGAGRAHLLQERDRARGQVAAAQREARSRSRAPCTGARRAAPRRRAPSAMRSGAATAGASARRGPERGEQRDRQQHELRRRSGPRGSSSTAPPASEHQVRGSQPRALQADARRPARSRRRAARGSPRAGGRARRG